MQSYTVIIGVLEMREKHSPIEISDLGMVLVRGKSNSSLTE